MSPQKTLRFCSYCGQGLITRVPEGDERERPWCEQCGVAHYQNPTILVAAFLHCGDKLLWTQRGIEPGKGKWAFPAGFVECDESLQQAAARELMEETAIEVEADKLIPMSLSSVLPIDQIYVVFRYPCASEIPASKTPETLDWAWLRRDEAPWEQMAHIHSKRLVEQVYTAVETGQFFMRVGHMGSSGNHHQCYALSDN